jgi:(4S)-4-hydroxy-5-phosphonooxypentane-2,3-dione isomerase
MFVLVVSLKVKPERREDFLKAAQEDSRGSSNDEPNCLRFDVVEDNANPNHFYFYEVYRNEEALKEHSAAPHYQVWRAAVESGVLEEPAVVARCTSHFPADADWR